MMIYDYDDAPKHVFHPISKKKAWLWSPDCWNGGRDTWEYKYMKNDYPKPPLIFENLP